MHVSLRKLGLLALLSLYSVSPVQVLAASSDSHIILPASPWYFLVQTKEWTERTFVFTSQQKREILLSQAERRLEEAIILAKQKQNTEALYQVANYTDLISQVTAIARSEPHSPEIAVSIDKSLTKNAPALEAIHATLGPRTELTNAATTTVWIKSELTQQTQSIPKKSIQTPTALPTLVATPTVNALHTPIPSPISSPSIKPLLTASAVPTLSLSPSPLPLSTPQPAPIPIPDQPQNSWSLITETVPDRSSLNPGVHFIKTWTVKNTGATTWKNYQLRSFSGTNLADNAQSVIAIPVPLAPNSMITLSIPMISPLQPGIFLSGWRTFSNQGVAFGEVLTTVISITDPKLVSSIAPPSSGTVNVPIVMYHYIRTVDPKADPLGFALSVTPQDFEQELQFLQTHGYHTVNMDDVYNATTRNAALPAKPIVLTFDDGYLDFYTTAYPLIKKYGFIAVSYAVPGFCGNARYMSWDQLKEVSLGGMQIAAHTVHHINLASADAKTARGEIVDSKQQLEQHLDIKVNHFAYPYGKFNDQVITFLREAGFLTATTTYPGRIHTAANLLTLRRVRASGGEGLDSFISKVR